MKKILLLAMLSIGTAVLAQTAKIPETILDGMMEETHYKARDFSIEKSSLSKYLGDYHFGDSEWEWTFTIAKSSEGYSAKIAYQVYSDKKKNFENKVQNYKITKFTGGQIYFGNYRAIVTTYKDGQNAILVYGNPTENKIWKNQVYLGFKN